MWNSRRKSSRENDSSISPLIRRSSSNLNFVRSSLKDVEHLFADDVTNTFIRSPDDVTTAITTATTAARRLSIFHRVHLANKFARAFATKETPKSPKSTQDSKPILIIDKSGQLDKWVEPKSPKDSKPTSPVDKSGQLDIWVDLKSSQDSKPTPKIDKSGQLDKWVDPNSLQDSKPTSPIDKSGQLDKWVDPNSPFNLKPTSAINNSGQLDKWVDLKSAQDSKPTPPINNSGQIDKWVESDRVISIPGAEKRVVVYTTSLRVVRPTFEACRSVKSILRSFRVSIDERDLSMDSRFLHELHNIMSENNEEDEIDKKLDLPRVFIGGKYIGGAEEVKQLHESGELKKFVDRLPAVAGGVCESCGDFRFVVCDECNGSHKCYSDKNGFRSCTLCNENGLIRCSLCE